MSLQPSDGLSRFNVGGKTPFREIIEKIASVLLMHPINVSRRFVDDIFTSFFQSFLQHYIQFCHPVVLRCRVHL